MATLPEQRGALKVEARSDLELWAPVGAEGIVLLTRGHLGCLSRNFLVMT